jgi:hypothetical protein
MNPNYGYQLYQIQRIKTRAEVLADDARRGRCAAAVARVAGEPIARRSHGESRC